MTKEQRQSIINDSVMETMIEYKNRILELKNQSESLYDIHFELLQKHGCRNKEVRQSLFNYNDNQNQIRDLEKGIIDLFMNYKP